MVVSFRFFDNSFYPKNLLGHHSWTIEKTENELFPLPKRSSGKPGQTLPFNGATMPKRCPRLGPWAAERISAFEVLVFISRLEPEVLLLLLAVPWQSLYQAPMNLNGWLCRPTKTRLWFHYAYSIMNIWWLISGQTCQILDSLNLQNNPTEHMEEVGWQARKAMLKKTHCPFFASTYVWFTALHLEWISLLSISCNQHAESSFSNGFTLFSFTMPLGLYGKPSSLSISIVSAGKFMLISYPIIDV